VINGLLFVLRRHHKRRSPSGLQCRSGFMFFGRQILFRVRVWTGDSKATTFCSGAACLLVSHWPLALRRLLDASATFYASQTSLWDARITRRSLYTGDITPARRPRRLVATNTFPSHHC